MYKWNIFDVFSLLGISTPQHKEEVMVPCPFCGGKRFAMNQRIGAGHCFKCGQTADSASYYAQSVGLSIEEGRRDIERRLNINDPQAAAMPERVVFKAAEQIPMAKINDLDFTYRSFLEEMTLSEKNRNALLARGFSDRDIEVLGYKTFPNPSEVNFFDVCRRLQHRGCNLKGVPGFYQSKYGDWTFVPITQGIILPQRTVNNQIWGFQIRKDDDLRTYNDQTGELEAKCVWFSSKNCRSGCGSQAQVSFSCDFRFDEKNTHRYWPVAKHHKIVFTEGSLKGDLIHALEPDMPAITVPGVYSLTYLENTLKYLNKLGITDVLHAFDMDYKTNPEVARQLDKAEKIIRNSGMNYMRAEWDTGVEIEGRRYSLLKGMDDYLAFLKKGVVPKIKEPAVSSKE